VAVGGLVLLIGRESDDGSWVGSFDWSREIYR
jgi:hypothetical protein